jgi:sortase A
VSALRGSDHPVLTLITCYPFFYLGAAPQRYIVRASLVTHPSQTKLQ